MAEVESVEAVRAQKPTVTSGGLTTGTPKPLGVPEYTMGPDGTPVPFTVPGGVEGDVLGVPIPRVPIAPHFFDGDELKPATLAPGQVARLQEILVQIGVLDGEFTKGYWDPRSISAYKQVLEFANQSGIADEMTAIQRIAETGGLAAKVGSDKRAPLTVRRSNPLDLKKNADAVAQSVLGRKLREDEVPSIVSAIQALETQAQTQAYNAAETGGAVTEPPTVEAFVEQKLRLDNPVEARTMDELETGNEFFDLLSGSGG